MGGGAGVAQGVAAVGMDPGGHIHRHQAGGPLLLTGLQQLLQGRLGGAVLADAQQGIDPQGGAGWIGGFGCEAEAEPFAMPQVGRGEGLVRRHGAPDRRGDAGEVQFAGDDQAIAAVVARPHQHQGPMPLQVGPPATTEGCHHGQGRLFHQRLHRQSAGKQGLLECGHLAAAHQQMGGAALRPWCSGVEGGRGVQGRAASLGFMMEVSGPPGAQSTF